MTVFAPRPVLSSLAEARAWLASLGLGAAPVPAPAPVLSADLVVREPVPAMPTARRPGWAVLAEATLGATPYGPVPVAGARPVLAGEALPAGTDAVLPPEAAADAGPWVEVTASAAPGEGVVQTGGHVPEGQVLARAGTSPPLLARLLAAGGAEPMLPLLRSVTPEGLSLGPVACPVIAGLGARPIEDTALGHDDHGRPALSLPADPAARLLAWLALVAPASGHVTATLARKLPSAAGLSDLVPVRLSGGVATPLAAADAPSLSAFTLAAGWVEVPPGSEGWPEGVPVTVTLLPPCLVG
jgi:molybdopterin molybdotransferase